MNLAPHILAHGNWISMEEFMEIALYDPDGGYYSTNIADIGYRGDFSTTATMSDLLARRLVQQWEQSCQACGRRLPIIEIGGGNGDLAVSMARSLGFFNRLRVKYYMVDRAKALRDVQLMVGGNFVRVYETIEKALKHAGGRAFIFSNELPDAFPTRQFVYQDGKWLELGYSVNHGQFVRAVKERPLPESCAFARWAYEGQIIEVQESYHKWYAAWQPLWKCGTMVTIDYGELNNTLYHRRPAGTLRGYKAHQLVSADELPALAGRCDVTADVNFSDLLQLAQNCVGDRVQYMSQHDYLAPLADPTSAADRHLIAIPGAGDHFNVLLQHRFES